jgi:NAD+ kinase
LGTNPWLFTFFLYLATPFLQKMMNLSLYGRAFATGSPDPIREIIALLQARQVAFSMYRPFRDFLQTACHIDLSATPTFEQLPPPGTDCLISIGGDGTFLGCLPHVRNSGIPVVGINWGRLGFLSAASFEALPDTIDEILAQKYTIEERALLEINCEALPDTIYPYALNEVGVQRHSPAMMGVHVQLNNDTLPTYWSDGLLVATPTGSTAYSMSVGGPIVVPSSRSLILSPIAPHNLSVRSLVVADDVVVSITVETRESNAFLTIDNQLIEINSGTKLTVRKANFALRVVRLPGNNFFDTIREKLSWGKDNRNM